MSEIAKGLDEAVEVETFGARPPSGPYLHVWLDPQMVPCRDDRLAMAGVCCLAEARRAPVTRSSGRTCRGAANGHLGRAFMWSAFTSIRLSPWAREGCEHADNRTSAVRCTLVRVAGMDVGQIDVG